MPADLSAIHFDPKDFPAEPMPCLRCGTEVPMQFRGMCESCTGELRAKYETEGRVVAGAEYEPTMHVTPNGSR